MRAIEVKPVRVQDRKIVHHVLAYLLQDEPEVTGLASTAHEHQQNAGLFMEWAVGKTGQVFAPDAGKLMLPGSRIRWEVHLHAVGAGVQGQPGRAGGLLLSEGLRAEAPHGADDVQRGAELRSRHSAQREDHHAELLRAAGTGALGEFPAAHAHARYGDGARGDLSRRPQGNDQRR